jgi:hypothetical protein
MRRSKAANPSVFEPFKVVNLRWVHQITAMGPDEPSGFQPQDRFGDRPGTKVICIIGTDVGVMSFGPHKRDLRGVDQMRDAVSLTWEYGSWWTLVFFLVRLFLRVTSKRVLVR